VLYILSCKKPAPGPHGQLPQPARAFFSTSWVGPKVAKAEISAR
jgi:hypothetical protein